MQSISKARRITTLLEVPFCSHRSSRFLSPTHHHRMGEYLKTPPTFSSFSITSQWRWFSGVVHGYGLQSLCYPMTSIAPYSLAAIADNEGPTEAVKELYDKILESVNTKRTMAPNTWTHSMIENCKTPEDIKLLFDLLQNLRRFRLSNLRIYDNFNCNLCREVTKACVRVGALDFGKRALWKHNVYGLSPNIGSAHHLLEHSKEYNNVALMEEVMYLIKRNDLPLQPGTADIVFSICYNTDNWELLNKYGKRFVKAGVKLHKSAFDIWMDFAAKTGDVECLWKVEKLRLNSMERHTLLSGFSCAKGLLLEQKPEEAASVIELLNQSLPDKKRPRIIPELEKLVNQWPLEVIKHQKLENRKALAASLRVDISALVSRLMNTGLAPMVTVNLDDSLTKDEVIMG